MPKNIKYAQLQSANEVRTKQMSALFVANDILNMRRIFFFELEKTAEHLRVLFSKIGSKIFWGLH